MFQQQSISVVFPAYNEEKNIVQAIEEFQKTELVDEIIVVNNNSRDKTRELALQTGARVVDEPAQGYGEALRRGLREAAGEIIVLAEPDGTFVATDILKLLSYAGDFDVVLGTRTAPELIWQGANMGLFLRLGNELVAKLLEFLFSGPSLTDCGCTFRLIKKSAYLKIGPQLTVKGSHFLPEMVILALVKKLRVIEIPLNYRFRIGQSKITGTWMGAFKTGMRMIFLILRYRFTPLS